MTQDLTFLDLCSGMGSTRMVFKDVATCVGYCEIDSLTMKMHRLIHGSKVPNFGDLLLIEPRELPHFDILTAAFPRIPFGRSGNNAGFEEKRARVFYGITRILKERQPKMFFLENNKEFLTHALCASFLEAGTLLREAGYRTFFQKLDYMDFGNPQAGGRAYLVGIRQDIYKGPFLFPKGTNQPYDIPSFLIDESDQHILRHQKLDTFVKTLANKHNQGIYTLEDILDEEYLVVDVRFSGLRLFRDKIPTISCSKSGILYVRERELRSLSGLEAMLLQGYEPEVAQKVVDVFDRRTTLVRAAVGVNMMVVKPISVNMVNYLKDT